MDSIKKDNGALASQLTFLKADIQNVFHTFVHYSAVITIIIIVGLLISGDV